MDRLVVIIQYGSTFQQSTSQIHHGTITVPASLFATRVSPARTNCISVTLKFFTMTYDFQLIKLRYDIGESNQACALLLQRQWASTIWQHHVRQANRARKQLRPATHAGKCSFLTPKYILYSTVPNTDTSKIHNSIIRNLETKGREYSKTGIAVYQFISYNEIILDMRPPSDAKTPSSSRNSLSFVEPGALQPSSQNTAPLILTIYVPR